MAMKHFCICLLVGITLWSCSKNEPTYTSEKTGQLKLKFDHIVQGKTLVLNSYTYSNAHQENFTVSKLKYYVSNIKLTNDKGEVFIPEKKERYFLIDAEQKSSLQPKLSVPEGNYRTLEFLLGVDSLTNTLPIAERIGVLDVATNDMYWGWNSGYIFFKLEGSTTIEQQKSTFRYHIGLFGGYNSPTANNIKAIRIDLQPAGMAKVQQNLSADIHLMVDIAKVFNGKHNISIAEYSNVMTTGPHQQIADNYSSMFTHDHTHNFQKLNASQQ